MSLGKQFNEFRGPQTWIPEEKWRVASGADRPLWKLRWWVAMRLIGHDPKGTIVVSK